MDGQIKNENLDWMIKILEFDQINWNIQLLLGKY